MAGGPVVLVELDASGNPRNAPNIALGATTVTATAPITASGSLSALTIAISAASGSAAGSQSAANFARTNETYAQWAATDASSVVMDLSQGRNITLLTTSAVGSSRTIANPTNAQVGWYYLDVTSHAATGIDVAWDTNYVFANSLAPHLSGLSGCKDLIAMYWNGSKMIVSLAAANHG
jgi:hypothetical protein